MVQNETLEAAELFEAQAHIYRHLFSYVNSMSLACALQLGIPDVINNHNGPITLQELVLKLNLPVERTHHLQRLMRLLIHDNFFATKIFRCKDGEDEKEGYVLTLCSKLLLHNDNKNPFPTLLNFAKNISDPVFVKPWLFLEKWFRGNDITAFATAHGVPVWVYGDNNPDFNLLFNDAMASETEIMKLVIKDTKEVFEGVGTLVDVAGGTGLLAKIILEAFPHMKCVVFDLPRVVAGQMESENLKYVGGDMFASIPSGDAVLLKHICHNWTDEKVLEILKRCKEAIWTPGKDGKRGKVIIVDMVVGGSHDRHEITETKLVYDMLMMVLPAGRERTEVEWEKLFLGAGFSGYKIHDISGLRSLIEVFP